MKKFHNLILSAGLLAIIVLPAQVSAQQNPVFNNQVTSVPLSLNNSRGVIHLSAPGVLKQGDQINSFKVQPDQGQIILDRPNNFNQLITSQNGKKIIKILASPIKYAALDHMPILTPDMRQYNMPVLNENLKPGAGIVPVIPK